MEIIVIKKVMKIKLKKGKFIYFNSKIYIIIIYYIIFCLFYFSEEKNKETFSKKDK